jgi:hypothetical protein
MAWTNWGFDGTINEAQWAQLAPLMGNGYVAKDSASCVTTAVGGARKVSVSTGTLFGDGIVSVSDAAEEVTLTTPVNGQWYVIALKRVWATNTASLVAVAGATTTTSTPTAPPSTLPTLTANPGVDTEQPIAWAWANSATTTVVVFDMRLFPVRRTPLTVASAVARDAIFQAPTQGQQVWRNDLGAVETYFGAYNAISNPGGRDSAGWYITDRAGGLIPLQPSSVVIASGTGSANALGQITFTNATSVSLNNVFDLTKYTHYAVTIKVTGNAADLAFRWRIGGTNSTANYTVAVLAGTFSNATVSSYGSGTGQSLLYLMPLGLTTNTSKLELIPGSPVSVAQIQNYSGSQGYQTWGGSNNNGLAQTPDGFSIFPVSNTISGTIQVFGYND